jgi:IclR family transcriptional regulator, KDG regulon repressor
MNESPETVLGIDRAIVILGYLAAKKKGAGVRQISRDLGYSSSVTQKILNTLKTHQFVKQDEASGVYQLGIALVELGLSVLERLDVRQIARPHLTDLADDTQETALLAIRDGLHAVYIDKAESPLPIRMNAGIGAHRPLNCTGVGKVLLAWGPAGLLETMNWAPILKKSTPNSIDDLEQLKVELEHVREQGFALDQEELHVGMMCVAAPVFNREGEVIAAITVAGPTERIKDRIEGHASKVMTKAALISRELGYQYPNEEAAQ